MSGNWQLGWLALVAAFAAVVGCGPTPPSEPAQVEPDTDRPVEPPAAVPAEDMKALVDGNNRFAIDLYKKLAEKETGNIFFSPYSISSALAMTYAGARGETATEMAKVLGLTGLADRTHPAHAALVRKLRNDGSEGGPEFHIANALWKQRGLPFRDEYLSLTRDHYAAGVREVDFAADTDGSRRTINAWVGEQTRGKIPELLKPPDLSPTTKLVLTNAVYFKADWTFLFRKENTKDGPFHVSGSKTVTVPLMRQTAQLRYAEDASAQLVELPYSGGRFSMVVILPAKPEDVGRVEATLATGGLDRWLARAIPHEVELTLPKFRWRASTALAPPLESLGMKTAFSLAADFSGLAPTGGLRITRVVHEACVELDENGTEASAATAVVVGKAPKLSALVSLDRPFLFAILHRATGALFLVARVMDPIG